MAKYAAVDPPVGALAAGRTCDAGERAKNWRNKMSRLVFMRNNKFLEEQNMKNSWTGAAALAMSITAAHAGGVERSDQSVSVLFQKGNYAELSLGSVSPNISGSIAGAPVHSGGVNYTWIGDAKTRLGAATTSFRNNNAVGVGVKVGYSF